MSTLHTGTCTVSVCNEHMETRGHVLWIRNVGYAPVLCHCHLFLNLKAPKKTSTLMQYLPSHSMVIMHFDMECKRKV